jgi:hypothetical protein
MPQRAESVLFITLDSCRYDSFIEARAPNLKAVGPLHRSMAPGNFTFSSHASMFMGFTPGVADRVEPYVNPKYAKIFKMVGGGFPGKGHEYATLEGRNIIDGMKRRGYTTFGTGGVGWFNPASDTGQVLTADFHQFYFPGNSHSLERQVAWASDRLIANEPGKPVFLFMNVGETHVPYYYDGAPWDPTWNPCVPFSETNDADECRRRQLGCIEYVDRMLAPVLTAFANSTILVCADHGDCWGENGLWEHGIHHEKVLEVPLMFRLGIPPGVA